MAVFGGASLKMSSTCSSGLREPSDQFSGLVFEG